MNLLSCPFCGHQPHLDNLDDSLHRLSGFVEIWVFTCTDNEGGCNASTMGRTREEAVAAWNRRAVPVYMASNVE